MTATASIPQDYFDFHKGVITGEASELQSRGFKFLQALPNGHIGFRMLTKRSSVLFVLRDTEKSGSTVRAWHFRSQGWNPTGKDVGLAIFND